MAGRGLRREYFCQDESVRIWDLPARDRLAQVAQGWLCVDAALNNPPPDSREEISTAIDES
jgi:hypothetical protein